VKIFLPSSAFHLQQEVFMPNIYQEPTGDGVAILKLEGEVTIEQAELLREALLTGLRELNHLMLNCDAVTKIDFFVIQVICSAHRTSIAWEKLFTWHGTPPAEIRKAFQAAGFARLHGCDLCPDNVRCMWV